MKTCIHGTFVNVDKLSKSQSLKKNKESHTVMIVAAEASSALYAQRLLELWSKRGESVSAFGVGSQKMRALGFDTIGTSEDMAVVGVQEVLSQFRLIYNIFYELLHQAKQRQPEFALLLDYPDFNLRLAKKLKKIGVPVYYYISPQLWAWRTGRIHIIKQFVDQMFVLFPFEKDFYSAHGVQVHFVGHPLLDELSDELYSQNYQNGLKLKWGLDPQKKILGLMPGSRKSEIKHHLETQIQAAERLVESHPELEVALLLAPGLLESDVEEQIKKSSIRIKLIRDNPVDMIALTDLVLVASGTATLMVALLQKPMVVMYKMNFFSAWMAKTLVKSIKHFALVNLVAGQQIVPELFQGEANPDRLAAELKVFLTNQKKLEQTCDDLRNVRKKLGQNGATERVADLLFSNRAKV